MSDQSEEIKIVGVDKETIKLGSGKNECWVVPFKLSSIPNQSWLKNFYEVQKKNINVQKRKLQIIKDSIIVEIFCSDDLQKVLDVLKIDIAETNVLCAQDYQKKLKIRQELEALQKVQQNITQKLKDDSDKLMF